MKKIDKTITSLRQHIVKKMSVKMVVSERVIDQVITHQFNAAEDATKTNNSLEISGFGKFVFNTSKANKKIVKLLKAKKVYEQQLAENTLPTKKLDVIKSKLSNLNLTLNSITPKV
jgi:nucleoid DNA-binding protein